MIKHGQIDLHKYDLHSVFFHLQRNFSVLVFRLKSMHMVQLSLAQLASALLIKT